MILVSKASRWYLALRSQSDPAICGLRVGANMPREAEFEPRADGRYYFKAVPIDHPDITYYPGLRYRRLRVDPAWWHEQSAEPLLRCLIGPGEIHRVTLLPEFERARAELHREGAKRHVGRDDPLFLRWQETLAWQKAASGEFEASLAAEDWEVTSEGLARHVHVDELEKIEGPPPEGPF